MENNKETKMLHRSSTNRIVFGICGGLGEYFDVDPVLFRIIFLLLIFGAGTGIILYLLMALLIPSDKLPAPVDGTVDKEEIKKRIHALAAELRSLKRSEKGKRRGVVRLVVGVVILVIGFSMLSNVLNLFPGFYFNFSMFFRYFWPVFVILIGLSILSKEVY